MIWSYERWKVRQNLRVLRLFVLSFVEYLWIEAGKIIFIVEKALQLETGRAADGSFLPKIEMRVCKCLSSLEAFG